MTAKLVYTFSKVKLLLLLDLMQSTSKLDMKDLGNSVCCSTTLSPKRGEQNNPSRKVVDSGIDPRMDQFYGPFKKGYGFSQSFKSVSDWLSNESKIQVFSGLLEREALRWFLGSRFNS